MELHAEEAPRLGDRYDALRGRRGRGGLRGVGMREPVLLAARLDARPPDAGNAVAAQASGVPGEEGQPRDAAVLVRRIERQLQSQADAERRLARGDALPQGGVEVANGEALHRGARRPHSGENGEVGARHVLRVARSARVGAEALERQQDGAHVAGAVLADGDPHRRPFVDGRPAPSARTAVRSARPTALNAASATWWGSRPSASTWSPARAAWARLRSTWSARPGSISRRSSAAARPPRSTAARASASSIGTTASPKRAIPRRSPRARSSASPSAIAASSAVWCSPVSRSPAASRTRSKPA